MDLKAELSSRLPMIMFRGIHVVFIAFAFEFIAWWLGRMVERLTAPLITADSGREPNWRYRRRALLRQTPKTITRSICYTIAIILVFDVFGVPVLPLSLAVGAVLALFGVGIAPLMRDATQGYTLLAEDALAVGDIVDIDGHQGIVEKFTLRGTWLRDNAGHTHVLANRDITRVVVLQRRGEAEGVTADIEPEPAPAPRALPR